MPLLLSLLIATSLLGCSGGEPTATKPDGDKPAESSALKPVEGPLKVALLTPGPVSDAGWSALAYDGLQAIKSEMGAEVNNQEAKGTQIRDAMRSYAQQGYNLVFGHGFEYNEPGVEVAKDFPNTVFVSSSGGATATNAGAFRFYLEQGFYLAGMVAGTMSKNGHVGMIGGPDVPSIRSTFKAFRAGAEAAKPGIKVDEVFTGQDSDIAAAKQATLKVIESGAEFVIHQANAAAQGVFDACKEKGVYAFGANADQNSNPSDAVIGSAVIVAKPAFLELAKQVKDGSFKGSVLLIGMDKDAIDFVFNPKLAAKVPAELQSLIRETKTKIKRGEVVVPKDDF
jgi:basic membrane lipoprotein Med (substrate-binding protein (PBP1-ABC) superfamily)